MKNICIEGKVIIRLTFNPGLALTGFRTILPCFQQVNLTWAHDPIENQHLVSGQLQKNTWPWWAINLSPRYGHVILFSGYLVLTGVNWSWHGCPISKKYTLNQGCMSVNRLSTYYLEYGRHVAQLRRPRHHAYTPTSNTASHENHEKIHSWVSFSFL